MTDFKNFYEKNPVMFQGLDPEKAAKFTFDISGAKKNGHDFETWAQKTGASDLINEHRQKKRLQQKQQKQDKSWDPIGGVKALAGGLVDLPLHLAAKGASALEGDDPYKSEGISDWLISKSQKEAQKAREAYKDSGYVIPGIDVQDVAELSPNLAYTGVSGATGLATGVAVSGLTGPVGGVAAGMGASGTMANRMAQNEIIRQYHDTLEEQLGRKLTDDEWQEYKAKFDEKADQYGLWEAIPEAAGQALGFGAGKVGTKALSNIVKTGLGQKAAGYVTGKGAAKTAARGALRFGTAFGGETATETVTEVGQSQTLKDTELGDDKPLEWTPSGIGKAAKRVAPQTAMLSAITMGVGAASKSYADKKKTEEEIKTIKGAAKEKQWHLLKEEELNFARDKISKRIADKKTSEEEKQELLNISEDLNKEFAVRQGIKSNKKAMAKTAKKVNNLQSSLFEFKKSKQQNTQIEKQEEELNKIEEDVQAKVNENQADKHESEQTDEQEDTVRDLSHLVKIYSNDLISKINDGKSVGMEDFANIEKEAQKDHQLNRTENAVLANEVLNRIQEHHNSLKEQEKSETERKIEENYKKAEEQLKQQYDTTVSEFKDKSERGVLSDPDEIKEFRNIFSSGREWEKILDIPKSKIDNARKSGYVKGYKVSDGKDKQWYYTREDIDQGMAAYEQRKKKGKVPKEETFEAESQSLDNISEETVLDSLTDSEIADSGYEFTYDKIKARLDSNKGPYESREEAQKAANRLSGKYNNVSQQYNPEYLAAETDQGFVIIPQKGQERSSKETKKGYKDTAKEINEQGVEGRYSTPAPQGQAAEKEDPLGSIWDSKTEEKHPADFYKEPTPEEKEFVIQQDQRLFEKDYYKDQEAEYKKLLKQDKKDAARDLARQTPILRRQTLTAKEKENERRHIPEAIARYFEAHDLDFKRDEKGNVKTEDGKVKVVPRSSNDYSAIKSESEAALDQDPTSAITGRIKEDAGKLYDHNLIDGLSHAFNPQTKQWGKTQARGGYVVGMPEGLEIPYSLKAQATEGLIDSEAGAYGYEGFHDPEQNFKEAFSQLLRNWDYVDVQGSGGLHVPAKQIVDQAKVKAAWSMDNKRNAGKRPEKQQEKLDSTEKKNVITETNDEVTEQMAQTMVNDYNKEIEDYKQAQKDAREEAEQVVDGLIDRPVPTGKAKEVIDAVNERYGSGQFKLDFNQESELKAGEFKAGDMISIDGEIYRVTQARNKKDVDKDTEIKIRGPLTQDLKDKTETKPQTLDPDDKVHPARRVDTLKVGDLIMYNGKPHEVIKAVQPIYSETGSQTQTPNYRIQELNENFEKAQGEGKMFAIDENTMVAKLDSNVHNVFKKSMRGAYVKAYTDKLLGETYEAERKTIPSKIVGDTLRFIDPKTGDVKEMPIEGKGKQQTAEIVSDKADYDIKGMRGPNGETMATVSPEAYGKKNSGWLGNPHKANDIKGGKGNVSRDEAKELFRKDFLDKVENDKEFRDAVLDLKGKKLGYYKPDQSNHLEVVVEWLKNQGGQATQRTVTRQKNITKQNLKDNPDTIYLFGDNLKGTGFGGQAKAMRGEPNAVGIPTKKKPNTTQDSYFTDNELEQNKKAIDEAFAKIPEDKNVVIPETGLGTGLAKLSEKAPQTLEYLQQKLAEFEGGQQEQTGTLEVSTQGDKFGKQFSAFNARLKSGKSIEEAYQIDVKGYNSIKEGKGKPPKKKMTKQEAYEAYKTLWKQWAEENPELMNELAEKSKGKKLTDKFAKTEINQARALTEILEEQSGQATPAEPLSQQELRSMRLGYLNRKAQEEADRKRDKEIMSPENLAEEMVDESSSLSYMIKKQEQALADAKEELRLAKTNKTKSKYQEDVDRIKEKLKYYKKRKKQAINQLINYIDISNEKEMPKNKQSVIGDKEAGKYVKKQDFHTLLYGEETETETETDIESDSEDVSELQQAQTEAQRSKEDPEDDAQEYQTGIQNWSKEELSFEDSLEDVFSEKTDKFKLKGVKAAKGQTGKSKPRLNTYLGNDPGAIQEIVTHNRLVNEGKIKGNLLSASVTINKEQAEKYGKSGDIADLLQASLKNIRSKDTGAAFVSRSSRDFTLQDRENPTLDESIDSTAVESALVVSKAQLQEWENEGLVTSQQPFGNKGYTAMVKDRNTGQTQQVYVIPGEEKQQLPIEFVYEYMSPPKYAAEMTAEDQQNLSKESLEKIGKGKNYNKPFPKSPPRIVNEVKSQVENLMVSLPVATPRHRSQEFEFFNIEVVDSVNKLPDQVKNSLKTDGKLDAAQVFLQYNVPRTLKNGETKLENKVYVIGDRIPTAQRMWDLINKVGSKQGQTANDALSYRLKGEGKDLLDQFYSLDGRDPAKIGQEFTQQEANLAVMDLKNKLPQKLRNTPVQVASTFHNLPSDVMGEAIGKGLGGQIAGTVHNGTVYLVADKHTTTQDLVGTAVHELVGHKGLREIFGSDQQYDAYLDQVARKFKQEVDQVLMRYNKSTDVVSVTDKRKAAEEVMARLFGQTRIGKDGKLENKELNTFFNKVAAYIMRGLRKLGITKEMSREELKNIASRAFRGIDMNTRIGMPEDLKKIFYSGTLPESIKGFQSYLPSQRDMWITRIQDEFRAIDLLQRAAESEGKVIKENEDVHGKLGFLESKISDLHNDFRANEFGKLKKEMVKKKVSHEDLSEYLYVMYAPKRNEVIYNRLRKPKGSGLSDQEAKDRLEELRKKGQINDLEGLAQQVYDINEKTLTLLVDYGLESQATVDSWKSIHGRRYVPLKTEEMENMEGYKRGKVSATAGDPAAKGRISEAFDPLAWSIHQHQHAITRGERNDVAVSFLDFVSNNPNSKVYEVYYPGEDLDAMGLDREQLVKARVKGQQYHIDIKNEALKNAMLRVGTETQSKIVKALQKVNRVLVAANLTFNPQFTVSNFIKDYQTAIINLNLRDKIGDVKSKTFSKSVAKSTPSAMLGIWRLESGLDSSWQELYDKYKKAGGKMGFSHMGGVEQIHKELHKELKKTGTGVYPAAARSWEKIEKIFQGWNDGAENAARLSAFKVALDSGLSEHEAGKLAKNLTVNFNRRGTWSTSLGAFKLFFNASMQGPAIIARLAKNNPKRATKILSSIAAAGFMLSELNYMMGEADDGEPLWDKVPDWQKQYSMVLQLPDGNHFKLPKPYGFGAIFDAGTLVSRLLHTNGRQGESKDALSWWIGSVIGNFSPIDFGERLKGEEGEKSKDIATAAIYGFGPTGLFPVLDIMNNQNWLGSTIMKNEDGEAAWNTQQAAKFLIDSYGGGAKKFWTEELPNNVEAGLTDKTLEKHKRLTRKVYGDIPDYVISNDYWSADREVREVNKQHRILKDKVQNTVNRRLYKERWQQLHEFEKENKKMLSYMGKRAYQYRERIKQLKALREDSNNKRKYSEKIRQYQVNFLKEYKSLI